MVDLIFALVLLVLCIACISLGGAIFSDAKTFKELFRDEVSGQNNPLYMKLLILDLFCVVILSYLFFGKIH